MTVRETVQLESTVDPAQLHGMCNMPNLSGRHNNAGGKRRESHVTSKVCAMQHHAFARSDHGANAM